MIATEDQIVGILKGMKKIKRSLKKKWVAALRSGKFKQGTGFLYRSEGEGSYCCLGVALVVDGAKFKAGGSCDRNKCEAVLDYKNLDKFGIADNVQRLLAALNDNTIFNDMRMPKRTFNEIADYIEKYL